MRSLFVVRGAASVFGYPAKVTVFRQNRNNHTAWSDKVEWVKRYLGDNAYKRLILTHHKNLNKGDYLIDDRTKNGADKFEGELILFGSNNFPTWNEVLEYLIHKT